MLRPDVGIGMASHEWRQRNYYPGMVCDDVVLL